jgi:ABC-type polysaccharide/polyol phosphate export permease
MSPGVSDLCQSARLWRLVAFMAWSDVRARYRRSVLGPLWITLGTAIGVVGLGYIWSALFKVDRAEFIPLLTGGLILWQFISNSIMESSGVFIRHASIIRNLDLPMAIYPAQMLLRQLINLAHNIPLFFIVMLIMGRPLPATTFLVLPGLLLVIANLYWIALLIGMLGARFRDLEYIINMTMPILMFFTPVLYKSSALPFDHAYMLLNPLADMIEIVRRPLLGTPPQLWIYVVNMGFLALGGGLTVLFFGAKRSRIAFWV